MADAIINSTERIIEATIVSGAVTKISANIISSPRVITAEIYNGPKGIQGEVGPQGIQGEVGPQGIQGEVGPTGATGLAGSNGLTPTLTWAGDKIAINGFLDGPNLTGPQGIQGIQGETGPQGIQGFTGPQGVQGEAGQRGIQGIQGEEGPQGIQGEIGPQGVAGSTGQIQYNKDSILDADANFTWDDVEQSVNIGQATILPDNPLAICGNVNSYLQINVQNRSEGTAASSDVILTADNGTDTELYADFGLANSNYSESNWDVTVPYDLYLFGDGGNVVIGSLTPGKEIKFFIATTSHEGHPADVVGTLGASGMSLPEGKAFKVGGVDLIKSSTSMAAAMAIALS